MSACSACVGTKGIALSRAQLNEINTAVQNWNTMVVKPLRDVRRVSKNKRLPEETVRTFRSTLAAEELKAEQIDQSMLHAWSSRLRFVDRGEPNRDSVHANLALLLSSRGSAESQLSVQSLETAARLYAN